MGMRWVIAVVGLGTSFFLVVPSGLAADGDPPATVPDEVSDATIEHIRTAITTESDPELRQVMEEQLRLYESGQLDLGEGHAVAFEALPDGSASGGTPAGGLAGGHPGGGLIGPPVEGGGDQRQVSGSLTPELREQLSQVFDARANGHLSEEDARAKADTILKEHGIDPREVGPGHEGTREHEGMREGEWLDASGDNLDDRTGSVGDARGRGLDRDFSGRGEGPERAWEHMSPEAREQMERLSGEHDAGSHETYRETFEREHVGADPRESEGLERPMSEGSAIEHTFEAPESRSEAPVHEFEAPMHEPEAPVYEHEVPEVGGGAPEDEGREFEAQPPQP